MTTARPPIKSLFEGEGLMELYGRNPDPLFLPERLDKNGFTTALFHGKVPLAKWLKSPVPLPSIPVTFWGSPVTDIFPQMGDMADAKAAVEAVVKDAAGNGSWAVVVKDLPEGDPLENHLMEEGFVPVEHDPIWYTPVHDTLDEHLKTLSKGRRRGLEGRWKKFSKSVCVRPASLEDSGFIKKAYDNVRTRSGMQLEELTEGFFSGAIAHPSCKVFIFEREGAPFAFLMLWRKDDIWFDKYMGTEGIVHREVSFYSMSILYLLNLAPSHGIRMYVAGQGCGDDKKGLGLSRVDVRLWIKPLLFRSLLSPVLKRFMKAHQERIYTARKGAGAEL